jgi:hypothetical protein
MCSFTLQFADTTQRDCDSPAVLLVCSDADTEVGLMDSFAAAAATAAAKDSLPAGDFLSTGCFLARPLLLPGPAGGLLGSGLGDVLEQAVY